VPGAGDILSPSLPLFLSLSMCVSRFILHRTELAIYANCYGYRYAHSVIASGDSYGLAMGPHSERLSRRVDFLRGSLLLALFSLTSGEINEGCRDRASRQSRITLKRRESTLINPSDPRFFRRCRLCLSRKREKRSG